MTSTPRLRRKNCEPMRTTERSQDHSISPELARRIAVLILAWITIIAVAMPAPAAAQSYDPDAESTFITLVNEVRAAAGVAPLELDSQLRSLSRAWTAHMHDGGCGEGIYICHASPISAGVTHEWTKLGENVGTGPDVKSVVDAFVGSPGHYANIVDPEFTHIGVGVMWDGSRLYTTHRFMATAGSSAPTELEPTPEPEPAPPTPEPEPAPPTPEPEPKPVESAPAPSPTGGDDDGGSQPEADSVEPIAPPAQPERVALMVEALAALAG